MRADLQRQVEEGQEADRLGPVAGISDADLLERYTPFMLRIVADVARTCGVRDRALREDMEADARLGLFSARRAYEERGGAAFSTYAYYRIKGAVVDGLRKQGRLRRKTRSKAKLEHSVSLVREAEVEENTVRPDFQMRLQSVDRTIIATGVAWMLVQTEAVQAEEDELNLRPGGRLLKRERVALLADALQSMPEQERAVIIDIYFKERSLGEISQDQGLSRSWLCRLHARALARLGQIMRAKE